jgi:hypothetical protein
VLLALPTLHFHSESVARAGNPGFARGSKLVPGRDTSARAVEWPIRFQDQLADALMRGIERYFSKNPPLARNRST